MASYDYKKMNVHKTEFLKKIISQNPITVKKGKSFDYNLNKQLKSRKIITENTDFSEN